METNLVLSADSGDRSSHVLVISANVNTELEEVRELLEVTDANEETLLSGIAK